MFKETWKKIVGKENERCSRAFRAMLAQLKIQGRKEPRVIDHCLVITGEIVSTEPVTINCHFTGNISSGIDLIVGKTGRVKTTLSNMGNVDVVGEFEGDIVGAKQVLVRGSVRGNIHADRLIITGSGCVLGTVQTKQFRVEKGGRLEGGCAIGA